jgi:hypothetical protein
MRHFIYYFLMASLSLSSIKSFAGTGYSRKVIEPDHINLSTQDFLMYYNNGSPEEKETTLMYVLGVADATEGTLWCNYKEVDKEALYSSVLNNVIQLSRERENVRASTLITMALANTSPCQNILSLERRTGQSSSFLHLTPDMFNLSANDFFHFWQSSNKQNEYNAKIYLLGIKDYSEGRIWCEYKKIKNVTLDEIIFWDFKKLSPEKYNERAAVIILNKLKNYPCEKGK